MELILASSSPYRRELLQRLRLPFATHSPDIDETPQAREAPAQLAIRLALAKARRVANDHPQSIVIGSDQVASLNGRPLGKPGTHAAARQQLRGFSGQTVLFHTAICVQSGARVLHDCVPTECRFLTLTDAQIEHYLGADRPYDTAGSAKIEALGIALMARVSSDDPTALIGLPLISLCRMLRAFGLEPLGNQGITTL